MGTRDYRRREPKKPKKGAKRTAISSFRPQAEVEVVKKGKKTSASPEE